MLFNGLRKVIKQNVLLPYWNLNGSFIYYAQTLFFPKNSFVVKMAVAEGVYERDNLAIIDTLIRPGTVVFDIGANIGLMSLPILYNHPDINLISVEVSPNALLYLHKTHEVNKNNSRWLIVDKAVSDLPQKVNLHMADVENGAFDSINDTKRVTFQQTIEVECTTIDTIWQNNNCPVVSFIKIDIEGCDLPALKGAVACINQCRPSILCEWNLNNVKAFGLINQDFFGFAQSINYSCFAVPSLNKVSTLADLDLYSRFTENFLLIPA